MLAGATPARQPAARLARGAARLDRIAREMRTGTREAYEERILRAQLFLAGNLEEEVRLSDLAGVACLSPYHFHRIFRGMTGETVGAYVRRLRLQRAASQLKISSRPVTEIAFDSGYESLEGFSRAFHERFGCSPSSWRETWRAAEAPAANYDVRIEHRPALPFVFLRHVGPYETIGPVFGRLFGWAARNGILKQPFETAGMPHDDPDVTEPERIRCDAALVLRSPAPPSAEVQQAILPERDYAVVRHVGPTRVWEIFTPGCAGSGCQRADASRPRLRRSSSTATIRLRRLSND